MSSKNDMFEINLFVSLQFITIEYINITMDSKMQKKLANLFMFNGAIIVMIIIKKAMVVIIHIFFVF